MNVDIDMTRQYYDECTDEDCCSCGYCQAYRRQVRNAYPEVSAYLDRLGIDIGKPAESIYWDIDQEGLVGFIASYWVFGAGGHFEHMVGDIKVYTDNMSYNVPPRVAAVEHSGHFVLSVSVIQIHTGIKRES
ncbi:MAG: hypothetical protein LIO80_09290 [Lachnospiraceae bacterium]|nr:hypothetical protein [Lachnospiraceae bacterium]